MGALSCPVGCACRQIVVLRHSLFALMGHDVMEKGFGSVALATLGMLTFTVSFVMTLMSAGIAEVGSRPRPRGGEGVPSVIAWCLVFPVDPVLAYHGCWE